MHRGGDPVPFPSINLRHKEMQLNMQQHIFLTVALTIGVLWSPPTAAASAIANQDRTNHLHLSIVSGL